MVLTAEQTRIVEAKSVELGMSWLRLMENAGSAAAKLIRDNYNLENKKVVIVCGKGNNGGDGYVIARKLVENKAQIRVISIDSPSTPSAIEMASKIHNLNIRPVDYISYDNLCKQYIADADIIVDAIFGTGFKGEPEGVYCDVIRTINQTNAIKVSIDVPSGINSDSGLVNSVFVNADLTITFATHKPCHLLFPAADYCGKVMVASIGMPDEVFSYVDPIMHVVTTQEVCLALPVRQQSCHKGECGTAALLCGSKGYSGAAVIAGKACVKSGVGIANMIIPESIYHIVASSLHEAVCTIYNDNNPNSICNEETENIIDTIDRCSAALLGCGLGQSKHSKYTLTEILKNCSCPIVIDADGINLLSDCIELIRQYTNDVILTPHPKEASRILNCSVEEIQKDRLNAAKKIASFTGAITVLKGSKTLIALPDGIVYVVTDGNPGMATAGTGDMLAGMVVSFLAQGMSSADAAVCAVKIHALSGDSALKDSSVLSLTPTDMIDVLPSVYCRLYSEK